MENKDKHGILEALFSELEGHDDLDSLDNRDLLVALILLNELNRESNEIISSKLIEKLDKRISKLECKVDIIEKFL